MTHQHLNHQEEIFQEIRDRVARLRSALAEGEAPEKLMQLVDSLANRVGTANKKQETMGKYLAEMKQERQQLARRVKQLSSKLKQSEEERQNLQLQQEAKDSAHRIQMEKLRQLAKKHQLHKGERGRWEHHDVQCDLLNDGLIKELTI